VIKHPGRRPTKTDNAQKGADITKRDFRRGNGRKCRGALYVAKTASRRGAKKEQGQAGSEEILQQRLIKNSFKRA